MKIGLFIGGAGSAGTLHGQISQIVEAEKAGFDSLWAAHIMDVDVMTMLSMAAEQTTSIEIGTAVTHTFLRHPGNSRGEICKSEFCAKDNLHIYFFGARVP